MSTPDFSGKTALITGASRGIGFAIALGLAKAGAHVLALARTSGALEELDDKIRAVGGAASLIPMDLVEGDAIEQLAGALQSRHQSLDILVLNAAMLGDLGPIQDIDPKVWQGALNLNLTANWRLLRALDPLLRQSKDARVLGLTSSAGIEVTPAYWGAYSASKAAFETLLKTYAEENQISSISTAILNPGAMRTSMRASAMPGEDPDTLPSPDELLPLVFDLLQSPENYVRSRFRDYQAL